MIKRNAFVALTLVLLIAGTSAFAAGQPLTMWGWNPGDIEKIVVAYAKTNPAIDLNYVTVQQAEAFQKLQTTVSAGLELPDLVPSEIGQRGTMMQLDIWENLGAAPYNFDTKMIFSYLIPLITNEKGQIVATPWDVTSAAMAYRRPLAQKYFGTDDNVKLQGILKTWDDVLALGKQVYAKSKGQDFMFASLNDVRIIADGQNPSPIVKKGVLDLNGSVKVTLQMMVKFRDAHIVGNISATSPAYNSSYASNHYILYPAASWSPTYVIDKNDPTGKGMWGLMVPPGGGFSWGGTAHMIPSKGKHKTTAFRLANWLVTKEGDIAQRELLGYNMANAEAYNDPKIMAFYDDNFGKQNLGAIFFGEAVKKLTPRPVSSYDVAIADVWSLVTEALNSDPKLDLNGALKMWESEFRNKAPDVK